MKQPIQIAEILVVEDNEDHIELMLEAFEDWGIANPVHHAPTLAAAREHLAQLKGPAQALPCVILLDLHLPDGHGLEFLAEIRNNSTFALIPTIVLTSAEDPEIINAAYEQGANSYIVKPVQASNFYQVVGQAGLYWAIVNHQAPLPVSS